MARYLSGIVKQLQDVSDLFTSRYGKDSSVAEIAVKTLISATLLEQELTLTHSEVSLPSESPAAKTASTS